MSPRLKVFVILLGLAILLGIIDLVRRRKLREEYSFIWLMTGFIFVLIAIENDILTVISDVVGVALPVNVLFLLAIVFIMMLCLYFSLRISALTTQVKNLAQKLALLQTKGEGEA